MKNWNLSGGAAKLEMAYKALRKAVAEADEHWSDQASAQFQETYLVPLELKMRDALDAIHRLDQVLLSAERDCGTP